MALKQISRESLLGVVQALKFGGDMAHCGAGAS